MIKLFCRDDHFQAMLMEKDAQCKESQNHLQKLLAEQSDANDRLLAQKDLQLDQLTRSNLQVSEQSEFRILESSNYTESLLKEKESHLQDLQEALKHQQVSFFILAAIAAVVILMLMIGASNEKRRMDQKYENIIEEKAVRIEGLEKQVEEARKRLEEDRKRLEEEGRKKKESATVQMASQPMVYAIPSMMPTVPAASQAYHAMEK